MRKFAANACQNNRMTQTSITPGSTGFFLLCLAAYSLLANLLAFVAFAVDRQRARQGHRRVPEHTFFFVASFGGWFGAALGQILYAEERRMRPFGIVLHVCGMILPAALAIGFVVSDPDLAVQKAHDLVTRLIAPEPQAPEDIMAQNSTIKTRMKEQPRRFGPGTDNVPLFHD
jgi:uncharacterized membrane protein YsdA (DUF1294 family)